MYIMHFCINFANCWLIQLLIHQWFAKFGGLKPPPLSTPMIWLSYDNYTVKKVNQCRLFRCLATPSIWHHSSNLDMSSWKVSRSAASCSKWTPQMTDIAVQRAGCVRICPYHVRHRWKDGCRVMTAYTRSRYLCDWQWQSSVCDCFSNETNVLYVSSERSDILNMSYQDGYSQAPLTFVDTGGDYGADTQGLDYEYAFSLSQTQTQTQSSQLTQSEPRATGKDLCTNVCL